MRLDAAILSVDHKASHDCTQQMHIDTEQVRPLCHLPGCQLVPGSAMTEYDAARSLPEAPADLLTWCDLGTRRGSVVSAVVLRGESTYGGKQRVHRALIRLTNGQLHFLSLTHPTIEIYPLLEAVGSNLVATPDRALSATWPGSRHTEQSDFGVRFLDENPCDDRAWGLENWRRQHTVELARSHARLSLAEIAARSSADLLRLKEGLVAARDQLFAPLNPDVLNAAGYPASFDVKRYNYLAHPDPRIQRNRQQAAVVFPLLIAEILYRSEPTPLATRLSHAIDSGEKLIDMIARAFGVKRSVVRALRNITVASAGSGWRGKLPSLLGLLSTLPPERFPRTPNQWQAFNAAIQFIKSATGHPSDSTLAVIILDDLARQNWVPDTHSREGLYERARCIETLITDLGRALAAFVLVEHGGVPGHSYANAHAAAQNMLIRLGVRRTGHLARQWQFQKSRAALSPASYGTQVQFPILLPAPFQFQDLTIVQLVSQTELSAESKSLGHCVETYGPSCMSGRSIVLSVRGQSGLARSTLEVSVKPRGLSRYEIRLVQHMGRNNTTPAPKDEDAVSVFIEYLHSNEAGLHLQAFSKERFLASIEPALARDYRLVAPMETFLSEATHGRVSFAEVGAALKKESAAGLADKSCQWGSTT